jgi:hypothetical protein
VFRENLLVIDGDRDALALTAPEEGWRYVLLRFDDSGRLSESRMPFRFDPNGAAPPSALRPASIVEWTDDGPILVLGARVANGSGEHVVLERPLAGTSVVKLSSLYSHEWSIYLENGIFGLTDPLMAILASSGGFTALWMAMATDFALEDGSSRYLAGGATAGLFSFDRGGAVTMFRPLGEGPVLVAGLTRLAGGAIALAVNTWFNDSTVSGAGSTITLKAESDMTGYVVGLNTNGGLECSLVE